MNIKHDCSKAHLTDLKLVISSVHDANVFLRGRELANITPKEHRLASFDRPDDCGFEFIARRVDVLKTAQIHTYTCESGLTKNRATTPNVTKLVDGIELIVLVPRIVDKREALRSLRECINTTSRKNKKKTTNRVFGGECTIEFYRRSFPLGVLPLLVVIFPGERNIGSRRDTKRRGHDGIDFLHELLFLRAKSRLYLFD